MKKIGLFTLNTVKMIIVVLLFINYRIAMSIYVFDPVMTFSLWGEFVSNYEIFKVLNFDVFLLIWIIFGFWYALPIFLLINIIFYAIGKRI
jgi:hypothetical protein